MSVPSGSKVRLTDHLYSTTVPPTSFNANALVVANMEAILDGYASKYIAKEFNTGVMTRTSAADTAQTQNIEVQNMQQMDIIVTCSAGTATLKVSVTNDGGVTYFLIDDIAAAASHYKHYDKDHLCTTHALNPLCWRNIYIEVGSAGVGNTTTFAVALKA